MLPQHREGLQIIPKPIERGEVLDDNNESILWDHTTAVREGLQFIRGSQAFVFVNLSTKFCQVIVEEKAPLALAKLCNSRTLANGTAA